MFRFAAKASAVLVALGVVFATIMAYSVRTLDTENGILYDGLGRVLREPPWLVHQLVPSINMWAGFGWHVMDNVFGMSALFLAFQLYVWGSGGEKEGEEKDEAVYLYHATKGMELFSSKSLPAESEGWFDSPTKAQRAAGQRVDI